VAIEGDPDLFMDPALKCFDAAASFPAGIYDLWWHI